MKWYADEKAWAAYLVSSLAGVLLFPVTGVGADPVSFAWIHAALLSVLVFEATFVTVPTQRRIIRALYTIAGMPVVFSSLALVLPFLNPEPWEWAFLELDRAVLGVDPTVWIATVLTPLMTELLQWCYATFYFIPIVVVAVVGLRHGAKAFDRTLGYVVFGFLLSYLGYSIWPTLPPYRFLWHPEPLQGVWLADSLHAMLDRAEVNRWDCFPSGHTMMTVVSLILAWRVRTLFWVLLPIGAALIVSTVALRYHYVTDVVAGFIGVFVVLGLGRIAIDEPRQLSMPA